MVYRINMGCAQDLYSNENMDCYRVCGVRRKGRLDVRVPVGKAPDVLYLVESFSRLLLSCMVTTTVSVYLHKHRNNAVLLIVDCKGQRNGSHVIAYFFGRRKYEGYSITVFFSFFFFARHNPTPNPTRRPNQPNTTQRAHPKGNRYIF